MKVGVVMNPVAGGGGLRRRRPELSAALAESFGDFELRETDQSGDAAALAFDFAASGFELVLAAGGDGTASEVADGLLKYRIETGREAELGVLPCGTGVDFARGLGIAGGIGPTVKRIAAAKGRRIDAGRICFVDDHGALCQRHFINIASLGISGAIDRAVNADRRRGRRVSAKALFFWRTVAEFLRYDFQDVRITVDETPAVEARIALVAVANGRYFGGGMMVAPDAEPNDGAFDIVILRASGKLGLIRDIRLLYGGRHRNHPAITILRGKRITVEPLGKLSGDGVLVDIDGESPGRIPATFEILPGALTVRY